MHDDDEAAATMVHVLLEEHFGEPGPDLAARVQARLAERRAAAARVAAAEAFAGRSSASRRSWAAALMPIAIAVVAATAWLQRADTAAVAPPVVANQDPEVIAVGSVAQLQELLPKVVDLRVEVFQVRPDGIETRAAPAWSADPATRQAVVAMFSESRVRVTQPAGWEWDNRLSLICNDGRAIVMALNRHDSTMVGMRGLRGDLVVVGSQPLATAVERCEQAACQHLGILRRRADFAADSPFRTLESLRLAGHPDRAQALRREDLDELAEFGKTRRLDVGRLAAMVDRDLLATFAKMTSLTDLVLDGATVHDDDLPALGLRLRSLSLRRCPNVRGNVFRPVLLGFHVPLSELDRLDLSFCKGLDGVPIALPLLRELRLRGAPMGSFPGPFASRLEVLDVGENPLTMAQMEDIAALPGLRELHLPLCDLGDQHLAILARAKGPLQTVVLNGADFTATGLRALLMLPPLREVRISTSARLSEAELAALAAAHPRAVITRR
ncbi:MAG: hypothetical protein IPK26_00595 [Planctomycetes bacterium]|nr:hypothetical protein [Planctomycetota bacterium]